MRPVGAPRLPPGGLGALQPRLTVVRKHVASQGQESNPSNPSTPINQGSEPANAAAPAAVAPADRELPSVMTCANYIKLPPYSSKEALRDRLMYAMTEGQGSFDLT